ncbi:MAG: hypothetical protein KGJ02_06870 [Verrucomicrobiota bacterium]|nr:hypothetical protein [Verrucomicrobiota bacterium]
MKKIRTGLALFGLTILATTFFLWLAKGPVMAAFLTEQLKIPVLIGSINLSPHQTNIRRFAIRNPHGFPSRTAFRCKQIQVNYNFKELWTDPIEIDSIFLGDNYITIEFSEHFGDLSNWKVLGHRIPKRATYSKEVMVHRLILLNTTVEIRRAGGSIIKQIDRMVFSDLDSRDGFPTKQLITQMFQSSGLQEYIQDSFNPNEPPRDRSFFRWLP